MPLALAMGRKESKAYSPYSHTYYTPSTPQRFREVTKKEPGSTARALLKFIDEIREISSYLCKIYLLY